MTLRDRAVFGVIRGISLLPLAWAHRLGGLGGRLWGALPWLSANQTAQRNIALCLPELTPRDRRRLYRRFSAEMGKVAAEVGYLWLWPPERTLELVRATHGKEAVDAVHGQGQGVIFASPHLGAWELAGLYLSAHYPMTTLYKPLKVPAADRLAQQARSRQGARLVPTDGRGIKALYQTLRRGETIGILPDQTPKKGNGVYAPFFGHRAYTMALISRLAARTGAAVFFCYALRCPGGAGFDIHFERAPDTIADPDPETAATALNQMIEHCVRKAPEQYLWNYRRFRRQPTGAPRIYPRRPRRRRRRSHQPA